VLPRVAFAPDNPTGGEGIPVFRWSPVQGAISYDMHVEQADGTKRDFTLRTTAFTPVIFYGTGVWHWQVQANFKFGTKEISGGYSPMAPFARRISTPGGVRTAKAGRGVLLDWDPALMAQQYKVEISASDSFTTVMERALTKTSSYAPRMRHPSFRSGERLYWRVAAVDEGRNTGGWATSPMRASKAMRLKLRGSLRRGATRTVRAVVTNAKGRAMKGAKVLVTGPGLRLQPRRTSAAGKVSFRITPRLAGKVRFQAEKLGYKPASKILRVR
jgi:hypothetical protein